MTWSVDSGVQVQNLISTIKTRLEAGGWTLSDRAEDRVWDITNSQGARMFLQITNCQNSGSAGSGSNWQYLQLQCFTAWNTGTHAGSNGSGTTHHRVYYAGANVASTTQVNLLMSVTGNRMIMAIDGNGAYRNWAYCGGLQTDIAGTNDPFCGYIVSSYEYAYGATYKTLSWIDYTGVLMMTTGGGTAYWTPARSYVPALASVTNYAEGTQWAYAPTLYVDSTVPSLVSVDPNKVILHPILIGDGTVVTSGQCPYPARGYMDGVCVVVPSGIIGHRDTIAVGDDTYLMFMPNGPYPSASYPHHKPFTLDNVRGLAILEA